MKRPRKRPVPTSMRQAVFDRDGGRCAKCGDFLWFGDFECHHRRFRSRAGKHTLANLVSLCQHCHIQVHSFITVATPEGFAVSAFGPGPEEIPVRYFDGFRFLTDEEKAA